METQNGLLIKEKTNNVSCNQGLVKGAELCLNPYFFGWLEKLVGWL